MIRAAFALGALLLLAPAALADEPKKPARKKALKEYQDRLLAQRETLDLGALKLTVTLVHDHFVYRMIDELLASDDLDARPVDALAEQVARMAERRKASMGKPALLVRFECASTPRSFVAFEGKLDDVLRVRAGGSKARVTVAETKGDLPRPRSVTLFRPSKSTAYGGANVPPTLRATLNELPGKPFTMELVLAKPPGEKAKSLELLVANLVHFSGAGMTGDQIDFDNGASAEPLRPGKAEFPLPLKPPAMPPEVRELMPEWKGE